MTARNHDIIVVGMELGGLIAAALLVKRGKNVLVVDPSGGRFLFDATQRSLAPSPNLMAGLGSGGFVAAIFHELDVPIHRRREFVPADPVFQVVMPGRRVDVVRDRQTLARRLAMPFPKEAVALAARFETADPVDLRYHETLRSPDLLSAPGFFRGRRMSPAVRELDRLLTAEDRRPFENDADGLSPEGKTFLTACAAFLSRFAHREMESVLARFHLGQTREGLHHAPGGLGHLTGLLKEKIASLRGGFCQAEGIESIAVSRSPHFRLRFAGLDDDFSAGALVWNTDPALLAERLPGRVRRSMRRAVPEPTGAAVVTIPVRMKTAGLPVGMLDDCVLVADPSLPATGVNLLVLSLAPGTRAKEECDLEVSFRIEDADGWNLAAAEEAGRRIVEALRDPIPFLDRYLVSVDASEAVDRLNGQRYEHSIPRHRLPLGEGATRVRTGNPHLYYAGREALPGLGMVGETVAGKLVADYLTG